MSMCAVFPLICCKREIVFGRFIPPDDVTNHPEINCPLCSKLVKLKHGRYIEEHLYRIPHVHCYVLPKEEELLF